MFSCLLPCLSSRSGSNISNITSSVKEMSLKAMKVHRQVMEREGHEGSLSSGLKEKERKMEAEGEEEKDEEREWVAEEEDGVLLTLVSLPFGGNLLKNIRFSGEYTDALRAQRWFAENCERIMSLYSILQLPNSPISPSQSDEEKSYVSSCVESQDQSQQKSTTSHQYCCNSSAKESLRSLAGESSAGSNLSCEGSVQVVDGSEFTVEDDLGVYVTVRSLPGGGTEVVRAEFSPLYFGDVKARVWWVENRERVHRQYSS